MSKPSPTPQLRSPEEVKADFIRRGMTIVSWCRAHGFNPTLTAQVIAGKRRCHFGQSHRIAVLLGLKDGVIEDDASAPPAAGREPPRRAAHAARRTPTKPTR